MAKPLARDAAAFNRLKLQHPWGTLGEPEYIARAVLFLASEDAAWITGVPLPVDGGYVAR
jgi:NAD(P)-dependent dehydrogenase (short-subunit alcohol dehydrogenase family)